MEPSTTPVPETTVTPDCRACEKELTAERIEVALSPVVEESVALPPELKADPRLAALLEAITVLAAAAEVDGGCVCDWCMRCEDVSGEYRVLPADRILGLRRGETVEVLVHAVTEFTPSPVLPSPYSVGQVLGALETWGQGWCHDEVFWNDVDGHSRSRMEWVEIPPDFDPENELPAIWYYADGEPPTDDSQYEWDKRPAVELEPGAVRVWFRVVEVALRAEGLGEVWVLTCELAVRPASGVRDQLHHQRQVVQGATQT